MVILRWRSQNWKRKQIQIPELTGQSLLMILLVALGTQAHSDWGTVTPMSSCYSRLSSLSSRAMPPSKFIYLSAAFSAWASPIRPLPQPPALSRICRSTYFFAAFHFHQSFLFKWNELGLLELPIQFMIGWMIIKSPRAPLIKRDRCPVQ